MRSSAWALLAALALAGCAQLGPSNKAQPALSGADAEARYQQGLTHYGAGQFEPALADLNLVLASGKLRAASTIDARKHLAFIYCVTNRQLQCREQFQSVLQLDPKFTLAPNEASHPLWGPVWLSVKGAADDAKALSRGNAFLASKGQEQLAGGMREYAAGHYKEAAELLRLALASGLSDKDDQLRAHKYAAFAYCLNKQAAQCQAEFAAIFALDPAFALLPSEAGHPAWRTAYRKEQALAKPAAKK